MTRTVTVHLIGAVGPGCPRQMVLPVDERATVRGLMEELTGRVGEALRRLVWTGDGRVADSLLIAVDGEVIPHEDLDRGLPATGASAEVSLFLIRPIFGGGPEPAGGETGKRYRGKTWDELAPGQEYWTGGRTVTESDVLAFSGLSGDFNPLHTDETFARAHSPFKTRVPHGPLIHDMYLGLLDRLGLVEGTALAFLELRWRFLAPVLVGDSIHARVSVKDRREGRKPDRGQVVLAVTIFNDRGDAVQEGEHVLLLARGAPHTGSR
jgi:acyl dehydratase